MRWGSIYKVDAVILARKSIGEADRILTIFSREYGKMKVIAKGIRKVNSRRAPHLEIFSHATLMLHKGKTWDIVTETQTVEPFENLKNHLDQVGTAYYICELVSRLLPEKQEHQDIFQLLLETLRIIDSKDELLADIRDAFSRTILSSLGFLGKEKAAQIKNVNLFIENILERRLLTPKIIHQLA